MNTRTFLIVAATFVAYQCARILARIPAARAARRELAKRRQLRRTYEEEQRSEQRVYGV